MRFDFHTHGKLAKKLPFSTAYTDWLFREATGAGLDSLCLTEHFNTLQFADLYRYLDSVSTRVGDTLELEGGLRIFPGMETDVAECGHILSIGPLDAILELNERLEPHKEKDRFLPFKKLMDLFDEYPVIVGCAHPYRTPGHVPEIDEEQLRRLMFLDLNGKDIAGNRQRTEELTFALGEKLGIPVIAGSDTHQAVQYGCITTVFDDDLITVDALYNAMKAGAYRIDIADDATLRVRAASLLKRALKEIHALGGDYVAILTASEEE
ncbi:hypothetical protein DMP06_10470 [Slackia equolifaciens]|uniref:PHP domain-containing protein n=1 Tax=Slackia equolifaciens TaxID=498718 RepID=A0A3N0AS56_9ACTN|nr:PHP-associated domain-containing protein [Slackia equolifaciens]RNL37672.1 hypothetical protein DMP06_10470 [Slackia equolifaciens]